MTDPKTDWPPSKGLSTPTVPRSSAVFQLPASIRVNAPASRVFDHLLNVAEWPKWNTFVPSVKILEQPDKSGDQSRLRNGTVFIEYVVMDSSKPDKTTETGLVISDLSTPQHPSEYIDAKTREEDPSYTADLTKVYRIAWKSQGGFVARGLRTERFHEIIVLGENECEVRTWEVSHTDGTQHASRETQQPIVALEVLDTCANFSVTSSRLWAACWRIPSSGCI